MMARCQIMEEYAEAYQALHGERPIIAFTDGRFDITTKTGRFQRYTAKDVRNLTRGLTHLAKGRS